MENRKNLWRGLCWLIPLVPLGIFGGVVLAQASHCGQGLAAEDLSGTCRATPATMGALEVTKGGVLLKSPTPIITVDTI